MYEYATIDTLSLGRVSLDHVLDEYGRGGFRLVQVLGHTLILERERGA